MTRNSGAVRLHPWAMKLSWKSELSSVTLANVLSGDTCTPISLADFERYLKFIERSVETLQFIVWFQDYREKFPNLHSSEQDFVFRTPCRADVERRAAESITNMDSMGDMRKFPVATSASNCPPLTPMGPCSPTSSLADDDVLRRTACFRAVATFLSPNAGKELPVDGMVRDTVIRDLMMYDCHPDVFLPVYEEVYDLLERHSLPGFLSIAAANTDRSNQTLMLCVGCFGIVVGLTGTILLIMLLPTPPEANRFWRLLAAIPLALGSMQCYAGWRGFCGILWFQGMTQLSVWEMQEMSEDTRTFISSIIGPRGAHALLANPTTSRKANQERASTSTAEDVVTIAPFTNLEPGHWHDASRSRTTTTKQTHNHVEQSIFGPVRAVLDPRIKAVHRRVFVDVVKFGVVVILVFSGINLPIPGRRCHGSMH